MSLPEMNAAHDRYAAFRHSSFTRYWLARFFGSFAIQIISVSVGWQIYDLTRDPFDLGLVGLVQFAPSLLLVLVTGAAADRFGRRFIMGLALGAEVICAALLLLLTLTHTFTPLTVFAILAGFGVGRAFLGPASASLVVNLVPTEVFSNAVSWNSSAWQIATIVGPVAGGLLYGLSPAIAYGIATVLLAAATICIFSIPKPAQHTLTEKKSLQTLLASATVWSCGPNRG